jgi:hypothetical protein
MDVLNDSPTRRPASKVQVLAGRITEVGADYLILGGGTSRILPVEGLASYFQVDQQVTITAVMAADGRLTACKIVLAPR